MARLNKRMTAAAGAALLLLLMVPAVVFAYANIQYPASVGVGKPFVLRVTSAAPVEKISAVWQGRTIPLDISIWNEKYISLGLFGTQAGKVKPGVSRMKIIMETPGGKKEADISIRVHAVKYREDHLTLPENMVTPPKSVLNRIAAERKETGRALSVLTVSRNWGLPLVRPVSGIVTSPYGRRRILNKKPRNHHGGVDFRSAVGTPVKAALPGRVVLTGDHYYAGKSVYVDSGGGVISHYFHLDSIAVSEGDVIPAGKTIGKSGNTGRSTGPHLHFGLSIAGQMVDSEPLFETTLAGLLKDTSLKRVELTGRK